MLQDVNSLFEKAGADKVACFFSAGKDSLAVLDLAVRHYGPACVKAVFLYLVPGLQCVERTVEYYARRFGVELIKLPHWELANMLKQGIMRKHISESAAWPTIKMPDIEILAKEKTDCKWAIYGHRMDESLERRGMLHKLKGINFDQKRIYPIWDWSTKAVYSYLKFRKIPAPSLMGKGGKDGVSGVDLRPSTLRWFRDNHPDDYAKILEFFPFADAAIAKEEFHG